MNGNISHLASFGEGFRIGRGSRVWHFASIEDDVWMGDDSVIGASCYVGRGTRIGDRVRIQGLVSICRNTVIEDDVFVSPLVSITDDKHPRSGNGAGYRPEPPVLRRGCSIGAHVVILPGIEIGEYAIVGAGAVVTRNVPPFAVVTGVPARVREPETA